MKEGVGTGLQSVLLHLNASKGQIREDKEKKTKIIQFRNMMCYVELVRQTTRETYWLRHTINFDLKHYQLRFQL